MAHQLKIKALEQQIRRLQVDKIELIRSTSTELERLRQIIRTLTNPEATDIDLEKLNYTRLTIEEKKKLSSNKPPHSQKRKPSLEPYNGSASKVETILSAQPILNANDPIEIEQWPQRQALGSLREEKSYDYDQKDTKDDNKGKKHRKEDTMFRLNTKRMSYKGFEFGDFGFMTTDFDQLSRGHTQWVNQVMHHPVQNGIAITASDDWCVMFWRFKKRNGADEGLKQERLNEKVKKQRLKKSLDPNEKNSYYIDPKLQHVVGEIDLLPVLKINTGLEVKAIAMSKDGSILACTCYDEEEDEGNPELQLYFDMEQNWTFKHHQFNPYYGNVGNRSKYKERENANKAFQENYESPTNNINMQSNDGRLISRRIVELPFEPIPHCLSFSRDNKYLFVAMYASNQIIEELKEELVEEYGDESLVPDDAYKWPSYPVSLCCVNVATSEVSECEKIWKCLRDDEHCSCLSVSPNGSRIAIGTSLGQLIVTGILNLTNDYEDEEDFNPSLGKVWSSDMLGKQYIDRVTGEPTDDPHLDINGSVTSIEWSADSEWIIVGYASGVIKFFKKVSVIDHGRRLSTQINRTLNTWMGAANITRKNKMFDIKYKLDGLHKEAINSLSICGSLLVSGADDGNIVVHDLLYTFIDSHEFKDDIDNTPIPIAKIEKIHGGRMVNSCCLTKQYLEDNFLVPSGAHYMITSGADNNVHCLSLIDVLRESLRNQQMNRKLMQRQQQQQQQ